VTDPVTGRLTDQQLDEIEKHALQPYRQLTLPTMHVRQLVEEVRALRDQNCLLKMKIGGSRAIDTALLRAAAIDPHTKLSEIQIERPIGPPFYLIDVLLNTKGAP
jgi:hypothetical protein